MHDSYVDLGRKGGTAGDAARRNADETREIDRKLETMSPYDEDFQREAGRKGGLTGAGGEAVKEKYIDPWRKDSDEG